MNSAFYKKKECVGLCITFLDGKTGGKYPSQKIHHLEAISVKLGSINADFLVMTVLNKSLIFAVYFQGRGESFPNFNLKGKCYYISN
jgi:hypothetical protein